MLPNRRKELGKATEQGEKQGDMEPCATPSPTPTFSGLPVWSPLP